MVYKYLGWGITNENGVAKLDHNSEGQEIEHSYTGTGAGEIDVLASLDNPVSSGSIVSETYEIFDCVFYDNGSNENWTNRSSNPMTIDRTGDYVLITAPSTSYGTYTANGTYTGDLAVEFDFYYQGNADCYITVQGGQFNLKTFAGEDCKVKIIVSNGTATFYKNGTANKTTKSTTSATTVLFQINSGGANIGYDEFKIYPI